MIKQFYKCIDTKSAGLKVVNPGVRQMDITGDLLVATKATLICVILGL